METEFFRTQMGHRFYERTMPELVRQVERLAAAMERNTVFECAPSGARKPDPDAPHSIQPGSRVVIRFNPHHEGADDIVGEVTAFEAGAGFMGCDLAYVRYQHPRDGEQHVMPFSTANLVVGDRTALLARATRHDEQAARLRVMPDEVSQ
jgi:hypothetical protein